MSVHSYLDLSTSHLTQAEAQELDKVSDDSLLCGARVIPHNYGMWVHVPPLDPDSIVDDEERALTLPNLHACIVYARGLGCMWIDFDSDGDLDPKLPTYEW